MRPASPSPVLLARAFLLSVICIAPLFAFGQDTTKTKDNSKPTNLYSQIDNFLEFVTTPDYNTWGYNPRISYAPSEAFSFITEIPLKYNTATKVFGLGDIRLRGFWVPYKNYDRFVGSFGASIDLFTPTGSFKNGLGSSSWRVSPGLIVGLILNKAQTISIFPNLSYIYTSRPTASEIPDSLKEVDHGLNFQIVSSFVVNDDFFFLITPIYDMKDLGDVREDEFLLEFEPVVDIFRDRFQTGIFFRGAFKSKVYTFSLNFTVFL